MITNKKKPKHYINNKQLLEEMIKYKESIKLAEAEGRIKPRISRYIGESLMMINNKLSSKFNFINYTYKDEMVADGIENCIAAVDNFDAEKSNNPFAYFTQIAWNAFLRRIQKEKKQTYIKHKNFEISGIASELLNETSAISKNNDYSSDVIKNYENTLKKKKETP
jgi:hypothetical protein